jgi:hypothetical protein
MRLAKRVVAVILVVGLVGAVLALPQPAEARGGRGHGHGHGGTGHFIGGVVAGGVTGLVLGSLFAPRVVYPAPVYAPPPVVYQPAPVYVAPPVVYQRAPICTTHWVSTYWNGYQWVPGYWAQTCR